MTNDFIELLRHEIAEVQEVHQQELDTRLDRIVKRIAQLETTCIGLTRVVEGIDQLKEDINRNIAEAELATRRHIDQLAESFITEDGLRTWWENHQQELDRQFRVVLSDINATNRAIGDLVGDIRAGRSI